MTGYVSWYEFWLSSSIWKKKKKRGKGIVYDDDPNHFILEYYKSVLVKDFRKFVNGRVTKPTKIVFICLFVCLFFFSVQLQTSAHNFSFGETGRLLHHRKQNQCFTFILHSHIHTPFKKITHKTTKLYHAYEIMKQVYPFFLNGHGMDPLLVLVSPCFRDNVVVTCKIGSFL